MEESQDVEEMDSGNVADRIMYYEVDDSKTVHYQYPASTLASSITSRGRMLQLGRGMWRATGVSIRSSVSAPYC